MNTKGTIYDPCLPCRSCNEGRTNCHLKCSRFRQYSTNIKKDKDMRVFYNRFFPSKRMGALTLFDTVIVRKEKVKRHDGSTYWYYPAISDSFLKRSDMLSEIFLTGMLIGEVIMGIILAITVVKLIG